MDTQPKNIVLCSDGTGNTTVKGRGTNVFKLYEALDLHGDPQQVAFYDDGVGSQGCKPVKLLGGAFGWGLKRNVQELYTALCRVYRPGDRIYLFGFSRGAYTVRILAGMILRCGILRMRDETGHPLPERVLKDRVKEVYAGFRLHFRGSPGADRATDAIRKELAVHDPEHAPDGEVGIHFLGVWDTVSAVGAPIRELTVALNKLYPFWFRNLTLDERVGKACQALAIDDERRTFHPEMWDERGENTDRIEQVWFAGAHSNVGGGYPQQGMSLVALDWMMTRAEERGLRFHTSYRDRMNVHDRLYDSRAGLGVLYRYAPRDIAALCGKHGVRPKVHVSALKRIALGLERYAPGNLPDELKIVSHEPARPGESAATLQALASRLGNSGHGRSHAPRLDGVRRLVETRRRLHRSLVALVALIAAMPAVAGLALWAGVPALPEGLASVLHGGLGASPLGPRVPSRLLELSPLVLVGVFLGLGVLVARSRRVRHRMASELSGFWRERLPELWDDTVYGAVPVTPARGREITWSGPVPDAGASTTTEAGQQFEIEFTTGDRQGHPKGGREWTVGPAPPGELAG